MKRNIHHGFRRPSSFLHLHQPELFKPIKLGSRSSNEASIPGSNTVIRLEPDQRRSNLKLRLLDTLTPLRLDYLLYSSKSPWLAGPRPLQSIDCIGFIRRKLLIHTGQ